MSRVRTVRSSRFLQLFLIFVVYTSVSLPVCGNSVGFTNNEGDRDKVNTIVLRQEKSVREQMIYPNSIYVILHDFDLLDNLHLNPLFIPQNCTLHFKGGNLFNCKIVFDDTTLEGNFRFDDSVLLDGTIKNKYLNSTCVGCKGDGVHDDAPNLRNAIRLLKNSGGGELHLDAGTFYLNSGEKKTNSWMIPSFSIFQIPDSFVLSGERESSKILYNPNRIPKHSSGNVYCGSVFSNNMDGHHYKVKGNIVLKEFAVEYTKPSLLTDDNCDYSDGQFFNIYKPTRDFVENYDDYNVRIDNVSFFNLVGHQGLRLNGADTVVVSNCKHLKAGLDTDKKNRDYSFYYINSRTFLAYDNIVDIGGTVYDTHCENVDIHHNLFIRSGICNIPVGGMTDINGNKRPSVVKFHDNIVNTNYVISPFFYRNTTINYIECYNNIVRLFSERFPSRYLFPSTDDADKHLKGLHIPISRIYIHDEVIEQSDTTEVSVWNRIFRTTGINELIIKKCTLKNLSNFPVLAGNNNGEVTLKNLVFSENYVISCGNNVNYAYPDNRETKQNQSVVNLMMWGRDNFDGKHFSVLIENNKFINTNENTVLLMEDVTNYSGNIDYHLSIRGNDLKSVLPISTTLTNSEVTFSKRGQFDLDVYDNEIKSLTEFVKKMFAFRHEERLDTGSSVRFHFGPFYYDYTMTASGFTIRGVDFDLHRNIGLIPEGSVLFTTSTNRKYYLKSKSNLRWELLP